MSWEDRLKEAAYTSPSGERLTFTYGDVSYTVDKNGSAFNFPDADGTYVQDMGRSGRRYPIRAVFWGADCDLEADRFDAALLEPGVGVLEHPIYGTLDVVPLGTITRRDDLKTAANQAIIEVTFWDTTGLLYPTSQSDPASAVATSVEEFNTAAAEQFEESTSLESAVETSSFRSDYSALLDAAEEGLQAVADVQAGVADQFNAVVSSINQGVDILIADPLTLAFQTAQLIQAPARAAADITARLEAYSNLAGDILSTVIEDKGNDSRNSNRFHAEDLYTSLYLTGAVVSVLNTEFDTKTEALSAAEGLIAELDKTVAWRDDNYAALEEIDTGGSYQKLQESVSLAAGFLVELSFSLKQERRVVLDRARTIVDLAAELYGEVDGKLDFLINSNSLTGSEILELPRGREIVYYV